MIDRNSVYCGLYTIVDEFKSHLSPSDLEDIHKENFVKSRSYNDVINKACPYYGFTISTLQIIAEYIESAAFGFICVVKAPNGIQKRYYSDNIKKLLQNALGVTERYVVSAIAEKTGQTKASLFTLFNANRQDLFNSATPSYWAAFQDKLNIRLFICMRYGHKEVFGQGVQFSNPFSHGDVVMRYSKSHDRAQGLDPFFTNEQVNNDDDDGFDQLINEITECTVETAAQKEQPKQEQQTKQMTECKADEIMTDLELLDSMDHMSSEQLMQLQSFASTLFGFNIKRALLSEAHRFNQIEAIRAFIKAIM